MFDIRNEKRWVKTSLLIICIFTLAVSICVVLIYNNRFLLGSLEKMNNDDVKYVRSGQVLLDKGMLTYHSTDKQTAFIMPGISFVMAFLIKLLGFNMAIGGFRILQCILHMLSVLLVFLIAREVFNSETGIIACIIDAIYLPEYFCDGSILTEGFFKFFLLLLTYISIYALKTKKTGLYVAGGIIWGVACLFRPTIALYPAVVLVMWILHKYSFKEILKYMLLVSAVFAIIMSPWWIRNYMVFHKFIPLTESSGNPMLQGTYIGYKSRINDPEYLKAEARGDKPQVELAKKRIKENFRREPVKYFLWYTIGKTMYFWCDAFYWRMVFGVSRLTVNIFHILIVAAGFIGMAISLRKRHQTFFIALVILYLNAVHLPYITSGRYAFPVMPLVIIFTAYSVKAIYGKFNIAHADRKSIKPAD